MLEAKYLRFLRTKEELSNYSVIKTIGKGYFGEVKLVRKTQDGRVYALKRLFKSEMISKEQLRKYLILSNLSGFLHILALLYSSSELNK